MKKLLLASLLLLSTLPLANAQIMGIFDHHVYAPPHPLPAGSCTSNTVINGDSAACTVNNVTSNDVIVIQSWNVNGSSSKTLTDSATGAVTLLQGPTTLSNGYSAYSNVWVVTGLAAGSHTLTAKVAAPVSYAGITAVVVHDANLTNPVDDSSAIGNLQPSSSEQPCADVTTTTNSDLLISFITPVGGGITTAGTGMSQIVPGIAEYRSIWAPSTAHTTWTLTVGYGECDTVAIKR